MIIAKEKRRSNISEYVIYMWHIEDLIRACKFDLDIIKTRIIDGFKADKTLEDEIREWYESIIHMMREQNITESGHLQMAKNTVMEMEELHMSLLKQKDQNEYMKLYFSARPNISIFRTKLSYGNDVKDIEVCLSALYSLLLLKMSGKEISLPTQESMGTFSKLLALLALKFQDWEDGKLVLE